ncbi:MAG: TlpA family protein disulfide reductase [Planctomycetes bacterium]|nr:TlpA family protein disulfide reductase [Planctomycetota bacterium]
MKQRISTVACCCVISAAAFAQEQGTQSDPNGTSPASALLRIRVLDESAKPIEGTRVFSMAIRSDIGGDGKWQLGFYGQTNEPGKTTDSTGIVAIAPTAVFDSAEDTRSKPIFAWTNDGSRIGMVEVKRENLGQAVDLTLRPACRVTVTTASTSLEKLGLKLEWANVYICLGEARPFACDSKVGKHEFILPPGEFKVLGYGSETYMQTPMLKIGPGETEKTLALDLPASRLSHLIGKPAPELAQIKGWKNGGPVKLAELKGKVVVLDFWGYWCGPCVRSMPELMELHERYKDKGLVIIAVHDDSAADIAEMDLKLEKVKRDMWKGKDLPFLVALDGGGEVKVEGRDATARGATTAAYGINSFPTQILIDKQGKVVGRVRKGSDQIEKLLGK